MDDGDLPFFADLAVTPLSALQEALAEGRPTILVTVARALGSTPREAGAAMLVDAGGTAGTVGGGALEMEAIVEARRMLADGSASTTLDVPLGPAIGQCCGGRVVLSLERVGLDILRRVEAELRDEQRRRPMVLVFGAGHTGQALARALIPLPVRLRVVDPRRDRIDALPEGTDAVATPLPEAEVDRAPAGAAFVVVTHDHALDFLIAARALSRGDAAYVGMIGSATKREKFHRHLRATRSGVDDQGLVLPIGGPVRDKRPEVIAALTAAEIITRLAALEKLCPAFARDRLQCNIPTDAGA